jgi:drug/metabolite transporter (DMT)-like permease
MAAATGRLGATRASATTFLIPVVALVLGVTVRGEHVAALAIAGSALCLAGAWFVRRGTMRA